MAHALLVPLDGSPAAEHALPAAIGVARAGGAALRLAYVVPTKASAEQRRAGQAYLDGAAQRVRDAAGVAVETVVLEDIDRALHHDQTGFVASPRRAIAHALATAAEAPGLDLVVMTTHGRSGLSRFWLGSVTEHLIHHVPEPILLVQPQVAVSNLADPVVFKSILVPLDGSPVAEQMLERAVAFGQAFQASYVLLNVIDLAIEEAVLALAPVPLDQREINTSVEQGRAYLERLAAPLRAQGLEVTTDVQVGAPLASIILGYAADRRVDLIAMKTHGRSGLARLMIGSTADKVLRGADVPVLLHRPELDAERSTLNAER